MARWTAAEDQSILRQLQSITDGAVEYDAMYKEHIATFPASTRTIDTFKVRARKIIKDHNIQVRTSNHWTEEDRQKVLEYGRQNPITPNWSELAEKMQRTELSVRTMYHEMTTPLMQVKDSVRMMDNTLIREVMASVEYQCDTCKVIEYSLPFQWNMKNYCESCYTEQFGEEVRLRWEQIQQYSQKTGKTGCNLCKKEAAFNSSLAIRFNYDHIDMFDKGGSVCEIVRTGKPLEEAYQEIDRSQMLCVSCHKLVTKVEHVCGFIRLKKQIAKDMEETDEKAEENQKKMEEQTKEYSAIYNECMQKVYAFMKETHSSTSSSSSASS